MMLIHPQWFWIMSFLFINEWSLLSHIYELRIQFPCKQPFLCQQTLLPLWQAFPQRVMVLRIVQPEEPDQLSVSIRTHSLDLSRIKLNHFLHLLNNPNQHGCAPQHRTAPGSLWLLSSTELCGGSAAMHSNWTVTVSDRFQLAVFEGASSSVHRAHLWRSTCHQQAQSNPRSNSKTIGATQSNHGESILLTKSIMRNQPPRLAITLREGCRVVV